MLCAFEHSERVSACDRQSISPWWEVIAQWTDQLVIFSGDKQKKNTTVLQVNDLHFTALSSLSSFLYLYRCVFFFLPPVRLPLSRSTLNLAVWLFISAHFSSCLSHREGVGDPADQVWVMVNQHSLWAMRAPLGWVIYTGPRGEQTYVSQSH